MRIPHPVEFLIACALTLGYAVSCNAPAGGAAAFQIAAQGDGNEVTVAVRDAVAVIDIHSRSGIGQASVELASGPLPETVVMRFHLKGLEELRFVYDDTTLIVSVSSGEGHRVHQRMVNTQDSTSDERALAPDSPYWMSVTIVSDDGTPRVPSSNGDIEVGLPQDFSWGEQRSFSMQWIDFFR